MSGTMAKSRLGKEEIGNEAASFRALDCERTMARTEWPVVRSWERMWEPRKPLAPVRRIRFGIF